MDNELREYLEGRFGGMQKQFDGMQKQIDELQKQMDARFDAARLDTRADIEKSETNLLRAFHGWGRSMEIRVRGVSAVATGFEERLVLVEERLSELERRKAS